MSAKNYVDNAKIEKNEKKLLTNEARFDMINKSPVSDRHLEKN